MPCMSTTCRAGATWCAIIPDSDHDLELAVTSHQHVSRKFKRTQTGRYHGEQANQPASGALIILLFGLCHGARVMLKGQQSGWDTVLNGAAVSKHRPPKPTIHRGEESKGSVRELRTTPGLVHMTTKLNRAREDLSASSCHTLSRSCFLQSSCHDGGDSLTKKTTGSKVVSALATVSTVL
eukprot:1940662-Amphidinium_carterae.1